MVNCPSAGYKEIFRPGRCEFPLRVKLCVAFGTLRSVRYTSTWDNLVGLQVERSHSAQDLVEERTVVGWLVWRRDEKHLVR